MKPMGAAYLAAIEERARQVRMNSSESLGAAMLLVEQDVPALVEQVRALEKEILDAHAELTKGFAQQHKDLDEILAALKNRGGG